MFRTWVTINYTMAEHVRNFSAGEWLTARWGQTSQIEWFTLNLSIEMSEIPTAFQTATRQLTVTINVSHGNPAFCCNPRKIGDLNHHFPDASARIGSTLAKACGIFLWSWTSAKFLCGTVCLWVQTIFFCRK